MALGFMENGQDTGTDPEFHLLGVPWPERLSWREVALGLGLAAAIALISVSVHLLG